MRFDLYHQASKISPGEKTRKGIEGKGRDRGDAEGDGAFVLGEEWEPPSQEHESKKTSNYSSG